MEGLAGNRVLRDTQAFGSLAEIGGYSSSFNLLSLRSV